MSSSNNCNQNNLIRIALAKSKTAFTPQNTRSDFHAIKKTCGSVLRWSSDKFNLAALQIFSFTQKLMLANDITVNTYNFDNKRMVASQYNPLLLLPEPFLYLSSWQKSMKSQKPLRATRAHRKKHCDHPSRVGDRNATLKRLLIIQLSYKICCKR